MRELAASQSLFKYQSGRVIALGRLILGVLFLLAMWLGPSEPPGAASITYALLGLYAFLAVAVAVATWRNWWLDARLSLATHAIDMAVFTAIVFSQNGTTSPFFLFFVLPLLAAAIRWSWRETALTASALVFLYLIAGLLIAGSGGFELQRFILRAGNLTILSLLLIWFGIHQRHTRLFFRLDDFEASIGDGRDPLSHALAVAIKVSQAKCGALMIGVTGEDPSDGAITSGGEYRTFDPECPLVRESGFSALLFDVGRDRALTRPPDGQFRFTTASEPLNLGEARRLGLTQGLVAEVRTSTQSGWLALWDIPDLSTDFIEFGRELGRAAGAILDRHALLEAIEVGTAARTRLTLARDVHDSIVQFLAGAAFRVEAIKRAAKSGTPIGAELDELKRLFVEEQGEIRGFITALRRDRDIELAESISEVRALAERLSSQWSVVCRVSAEDAPASIPIRLHLDLQHLLREAVANAVRHGGADRIDVGMAVEDNRLQLSFADNGSGFVEANGKPMAEPQSLKERVERADGSLRLVSEPGSTNILISLPLTGASA
ncbi:MAG: sensor histidine kinase [Sphingomicrobium sp.]